MLALAVLSLLQCRSTPGQLDLANKKFFLKYFYQPVRDSVDEYFLLSTLFYWGGLLAKSGLRCFGWFWFVLGCSGDWCHRHARTLVRIVFG